MWHSNNLKTILNLNLSKNIGDSKSYFPLKRLLNENSLAVSNHWVINLWMHTTLGIYFWALKITKYMHLLFIGFWGRNISLLFLWINLPVNSSRKNFNHGCYVHDIQNSAKGKDYVQVGTYFFICVPLTLLRCYNICCRLYVSPS